MTLRFISDAKYNIIVVSVVQVEEGTEYDLTQTQVLLGLNKDNALTNGHKMATITHDSLYVDLLIEGLQSNTDY